VSAPAPRLVVDTGSATPPYAQLHRQLETAVRAGALAPGQRLPPIRQLARDLGLAVGTVARAYRELEAAGLVVGSRGGGTRVAPGLPAPAQPMPEALDRLAGALVDEAALLGASAQQVRDAVDRVLSGRGLS
jgi:GntR family transcriptional regulator